MNLNLESIGITLERDDNQLIMNMNNANILFDLEEQKVQNVMLESAQTEAALNNLLTAIQVLEQKSASNEILALIDGREGELCAIMRWDAIPDITDDNKTAITESTIEGLKDIAAKVWKQFVKFIKKVIAYVKDFVDISKKILDKQVKDLKDEQARIPKLKSPTPMEEVEIEFGEWNLLGKKFDTLSDLINTTIEEKDVEDNLSENMKTVNEMAEKIGVYVINDEEEAPTLDDGTVITLDAFNKLMEETSFKEESKTDKYNEKPQKTKLSEMGCSNAADFVTLIVNQLGVIDELQIIIEIMNGHRKSMEEIAKSKGTENEQRIAFAQAMQKSYGKVIKYVMGQMKYIRIINKILLTAAAQIKEVAE